MKLVAEQGYGGASATLIAKDAKVSVGYFYMHYKGKYELVNSLLLEVYQEVADKLDELISNGSSFEELVSSVIRYFFQMANNEPVKIKFFYVLSNDYRFKSDHVVKESMFEYLHKVMNIGLSSNQLDKAITANDLFLVLVIYTIQFINQRFKNASSHVKFTMEEQEHLLYLINKILK